MAKRKYSVDMTTGVLFPKILSFAFPLMITGLLQIVYNAADVMVVGRFAGSISLAAIGATSTLVTLFLNFFLGLSTGSGVVVAKHIGAGNSSGTHRAVHTAISLSLICGVLIGLLGFFISSYALRLMGTPSNILELSALYLKIFFLGTPANMIFNYGASVLRAMGDSKRPLYILTATGILNVVLNLIFVIKIHMDVAGVALATIISQYVSAICVIFILTHTESEIHLSLRKLRIYKDELSDILKIGIPAGLQGSLFSVSNVIIQSSINSFGPAAIAGNTASGNVDSIIFTCCNSVSQTATTFTSQNLGAGQIRRIRKIYFNCIGISVSIAAIFGVVLVTFGPQILTIFSTDADVIEKGMIRLNLLAASYIINSILDVTTGQLRGLGKSFIPMAASLVGICGLRILWVFTIFRNFHSLFVLYLSYPVSWLITCIVLVVMYAVTFRKILKRSEFA